MYTFFYLSFLPGSGKLKHEIHTVWITIIPLVKQRERGHFFLFPTNGRARGNFFYTLKEFPEKHVFLLPSTIPQCVYILIKAIMCFLIVLHHLSMESWVMHQFNWHFPPFEFVALFFHTSASSDCCFVLKSRPKYMKKWRVHQKAYQVTMLKLSCAFLYSYIT